MVCLVFVRGAQNTDSRGVSLTHWLSKESLRCLAATLLIASLTTASEPFAASYGHVKTSSSANRVYDVTDHGADPTGVADSTKSIQATIDTAGSNAYIYIPPGIYRVSSTLIVSRDRVHIEGAGPHATQLLFDGTETDTLFLLSAGSHIIYQGSLSNLALWSNDSTHTKLAIDLRDSSGYRIENIVIGGNVVHGSSFYWSGAESIGVRIKGREFGMVKNLYNYADKPIVIADNPNSIIDIDHFHFQDLYLSAHGAPSITIEDGVNLSNVTFDGANPWVGGTYGLYWSDTTTKQASNNLMIKGLRTEQGTDSTAYSIYIRHNSTLQNLHVEDSLLDGNRKGVYLRKVQNAIFETTQYSSTMLEAFNATADTISSLTFLNCFWQVGSTAKLDNYALYDSLPNYEDKKPIPNTAYYVSMQAISSGDQMQRRRIPIIATRSLPDASPSMDGTVIIEDAGPGNRNMIIYAGGQRFRIQGGTPF